MLLLRSLFFFLRLKMFFVSESFIPGLILCYFTSLSSHVPVSAASCRSKNISVEYGHCRIHPDGVRDLDCFGKHNSLYLTCVWKPGNHTSEKIYTLIIQQVTRKKYCSISTMSKTSTEIKVFQSHNMTAGVFENSESTNCTKAVFGGSPKSLLRCGPPSNVSFSRHSGSLAVSVTWPKEDENAVKHYSVRYKALGSRLWSESPVRSQSRDTCTVENVNSSLVYSVQMQCIANDKCSQCVWSEAYTIPPELTTRPVIVNLHFSDIAGRKGCRLLSLTWKFPAKELHDGYRVAIWKASGEAPYERIARGRPELTLILSYSSYRVSISAVNSASVSPAVNHTIPRREDDMVAGNLNMTVHSSTSFTIYWKDNLIQKYVCFCAEWMKKGQRAAHMSFHESANNHRTLTHLPEPLEPFERYSIALHIRPNKDTCNIKYINNSESTYGTTQFYFVEGSPLGAPMNISSRNVTLNSMVLQWSSIREEDIRGFLLGYVIHHTEYHHMGTNTERNVTVDPALNSYELGGLKSGTAYKVQISAFTRAGAGARSTASLFETNYEGFTHLATLITVFAVVVTVLIFASPIIKRAKAILWPSIPDPGNSNAMQKIERPCELELLESINAPNIEEWDTYSLKVVEKEKVIPASTLPSMLPLLHDPEVQSDSSGITCEWIQSNKEDAARDTQPDTRPDDTTGEVSHVQQTNFQSCPVAFQGGYTTMEMFQQGLPQPHVTADTLSYTDSNQTEPEDTDMMTAVKPGLEYVRQFSSSPISGGREMLAGL